MCPVEATPQVPTRPPDSVEKLMQKQNFEALLSLTHTFVWGLPLCCIAPFL